MNAFTGPKKKSPQVLYTYVSKTNKTFVDKMALKANRSKSEFIDELIAAYRLKRDVKFDTKVLKVEKDYKKAKETKKKKINNLRA